MWESRSRNGRQKLVAMVSGIGIAALLRGT